MKKIIAGFTAVVLVLSCVVVGVEPALAATYDSFTVSNPRAVDNYLTVDINPSTPDNICAWWQMLHFVYLTNQSGARVGEFSGCTINPDSTYTFSGGQSAGLMPDTGTYRVEVVESEQPPHPYDAFSSTFEWTSPVPHVNRAPSLQLFDSPQPVPDLPQYMQVWLNVGQDYSVSGSFTDADSTSWTATVDYGEGVGQEPLVLDGQNFSVPTHHYPRGGWWYMTVRITDNQGAEGSIIRVVKIVDFAVSASNPRVVDGGFAVDLRGDLPDNLCSWFPAFRHDAYVLDQNNQTVGGFAACSYNPEGNYYTIGAGNVAGYTTPPSGAYKIKLVENEQPPYPYVAITNAFNWTAPTPDPVTVTFGASADASVRNGHENRNYGAEQSMRVQSSGNNRGLVRFDQAAVQAAVGGHAILSATLRMSITDNGGNWGPAGRTVDVHRLLVDWVEGVGTEDNKGTGSGVTWNCAVDLDIHNQAKNCSGATEWEMGLPNNPAVHPWAQIATDSKIIASGQTGTVEYDVTPDVQSFMGGTANYGWLVRKTNESQNGSVSFGTRESAYASQLVVTYQP